MTLEVRHRLAAENLRFVASIASRFRNRGLSREDLMGEGCLGLVEAARRYDPVRGVRFTTYAVYWIKRAILRALAGEQMPVHVPHTRRALVRALREAERILPLELGREVQSDEVGARLRVGRRELDALRGATGAAVSLDRPMGERGDVTLGDLLRATENADPERVLERRDAAARVRRALARLDPADRLVLMRRFGLDGGEEQPLRRVGASVGMSREGARLRERQALQRLRRELLRRRMSVNDAPRCSGRRGGAMLQASFTSPRGPIGVPRALAVAAPPGRRAGNRSPARIRRCGS
jgi:RNA polymerase primary sigma factor